MAASTIEKLVEQVRRLNRSEIKEFIRLLLEEGLIDIEEEFTEEEMAEIEIASQEVAEGKWVDFDEHSKKSRFINCVYLIEHLNLSKPETLIEKVIKPLKNSTFSLPKKGYAVNY